MKIYVDFVLDKHYTNRFSDTSASVFTISNEDGTDLANDVKVIDYVNSSDEGLILISNPSPKEELTSIYIMDGKLYMASVDNEYEIQGITIV